jgi:hypothetical protein
MIKSHKTQLLYRIIAIVVGIFGVLVSVGVFGGYGTNHFYFYYTNLSNYACLGFLVVDLIFVAFKLKRGEKEGNGTISPKVKFCLSIAILLTFIVADFILFNIFTPSFWVSDLLLINIFLHFAMPLLFIFDYFAFTKRKTLKWKDPFYSLIFPLSYVAFILIRAEIVGRSSNDFLYPYFFLDVNQLGYTGVLVWSLGLSVCFLAIGYLFVYLDHLKIKIKK